MFFARDRRGSVIAPRQPRSRVHCPPKAHQVEDAAGGEPGPPWRSLPSPYRGSQAADEGRGRRPTPPVPDPWIAGEYRDGSRRQAAPSTCPVLRAAAPRRQDRGPYGPGHTVPVREVKGFRRTAGCDAWRYGRKYTALTVVESWPPMRARDTGQAAGGNGATLFSVVRRSPTRPRTKITGPAYTPRRRRWGRGDMGAFLAVEAAAWALWLSVSVAGAVVEAIDEAGRTGGAATTEQAPASPPPPPEDDEARGR